MDELADVAGARPTGEAGLDDQPWTWASASPEQVADQAALQADLRARHASWVLGTGCFVSRLAAVDADVLRLGDRSYVAARVHVTGDVRLGADCSLNVSSTARGRVVLGDGVRVGARAAFLGFNHTFVDPDVPVSEQPLTSAGITVGDDVWVGAGVVVVDGVRVGARAVLAAGAVVTKDVPPGAVVGGNPARLLRWRVPPVAAEDGRDLGARLEAFGARARRQGEDVLTRCWQPAEDEGDGGFVDTPGARPGVRAQCDAVEVADLLLGGPPPQLPAEVQRRRLLDLQDERTGLVPRWDDAGRPDPGSLHLGDGDALYHVLCVGYALELLGSSPLHPVRVVADLDADALVRSLQDLPWDEGAWAAGHWVDAVGTALHRDRARGPAAHPGAAAALLGRLVEDADPRTGLWGRSRPGDGLLQVVNGGYRTARGTFGQWGVPLPYPDAVVDTVLAHAADPRHLAADRQDACAVLDVAWLLRVAGRQTGHRREEVQVLARRLLEDALLRWVDGAGFAFRAGPAADGPRRGPGDRPGLQGTEMWLAVTWELAALLGLEAALPYRPRGVHLPDPR